MAQSRGSSNSPDVRDLVEVVETFQMTNNCFIEIRMEVKADLRGPDLHLNLIAHPSREQVGVVPPLASVNVTCLAMNKQTVDACLIHALYVLDFQIALNEFESVPKKS